MNRQQNRLRVYPASQPLGHLLVGRQADRLFLGRPDASFPYMRVGPAPHPMVQQFRWIRYHFGMGQATPINRPDETFFNVDRRVRQRDQNLVQMPPTDMFPSVLFTDRFEQLFDPDKSVFIGHQTKLIGLSAQHIGQQFCQPL